MATKIVQGDHLCGLVRPLRTWTKYFVTNCYKIFDPGSKLSDQTTPWTVFVAISGPLKINGLGRQTINSASYICPIVPAVTLEGWQNALEKADQLTFNT